MTVRSAYGPKTKVRVTFTEPTMTKQSFKDECNINNIMARYQQTGIVNHFNKHAAQYKDTTGPLFTESQQIVANARSMFEELPSKVRRNFHNNPVEFLDFVNNPELTKQQLTDAGLAESPPTLPLTPTPPVTGADSPGELTPDSVPETAPDPQ